VIYQTYSVLAPFFFDNEVIQNLIFGIFKYNEGLYFQMHVIFELLKCPMVKTTLFILNYLSNNVFKNIDVSKI